jgi:hypothetical protein
MPKSKKNLFQNRASSVKGLQKRGVEQNYLEMTLIEDIVEANKHIGEHIDSLTRRATLIQEYLLEIHPDITIRMIRRILTKDIDKS